MQALESVLAQIGLFAPLRADELGRIARRFAITRLAAGGRESFAERLEDARLVVVVAGSVRLEVDTSGGALRGTMDAGDTYGTLSLLTGYIRSFRIEAESDAIIASIDRSSFDAILVEFPVVGLPLASELSTELAQKNDLLRQLLELHAEQLPPGELTAAVGERREALRRRGARVSRLSSRALFRRFVVQEGAEPPFWMLAGFIAALGLARLVVFLILKYKLEKQLFALVPGTDPNPMHVHHFNYGLLLVGAAGLAALVPFGRRALRVLAFAFGFGCGLVFDEFALLWNLNPEYSQGLSLIAAAIAGAVLVQLVYFRRYWAALVRRAWLRIQGVR